MPEGWYKVQSEIGEEFVCKTTGVPYCLHDHHLSLYYCMWKTLMESDPACFDCKEFLQGWNIFVEDIQIVKLSRAWKYPGTSAECSPLHFSWLISAESRYRMTQEWVRIMWELHFPRHLNQECVKGIAAEFCSIPPWPCLSSNENYPALLVLWILAWVDCTMKAPG
jgi:hypothetical protein